MLLCSQVAATHIVGGELYYRKVTSGVENLYEVTLKVYRDCGPTNTNGTDFDNAASVGVFNSAGVLLYELQMDLFDATVNEIPVELENPCFILPPDVCVQEAIYTENIVLPPLEGGYDIIYQRCCRNPSIVNLFIPEDQGVTFWSHVPSEEVLPDSFNSSAVFNNFPPVALCANADFWFDHGATDVDGDSLVYEFCRPLTGASPDFPAPAPPESPPFVNVTYDTGFDEDYPITATPAFTIDPETGWIEGTPTAVGQYVIGICVTEYRDGVELCKNTRDFQFNVTSCDPNIIASIPEQDDLCDGLEVQFQNDSWNATEFLWLFNDPNNPGASSTEVEPTYSFTEAGSYGVTLIANPTWPCADTTIVDFNVWPEMNPEILEPTWQCIEGVVWVDIPLDGDFLADTDFLWDFPAATTPGTATYEDPINVQFGADGVQYLSVTTTYNGCIETDTLSFVIPPGPVASIVDQETHCDGFTYTFESASVGANAYQWDFGVLGLATDVSDEENPTYTFPAVGLYEISLEASADFHCPSFASTTFDVYTLLDPWYPEPDPDCFEGHNFDFTAQGTVNPDAVFSWEFGDNADPTTGGAQVVNNVTWDAPGNYPVTLWIEQDVCLKSYTDTVRIIANPEAAFSLQADNGCLPYAVAFTNESNVQSQAVWEWDFGDGTSSIGANPTHTYTTSGTFSVTVTVTTTTGCIDTDTYTAQDIITVHPLPTPGFDIEPNIVNILDPDVYVTDLSEGSVSCWYYMGDGGSIPECDGPYTYTDGGLFDVVQYVTSEHGCVATGTGEVLVEGTVFYAPNTFTPNNDGDNDVFLPSALGVTTYLFRVYNRWGEVIFETKDRTEPWIGNVNGGDHFAKDGLYVWTVWYEDLLGLPHAHQGHVNLLR